MPKQGKYIDIIIDSIRIRDELRRQIAQSSLNYTELGERCAFYGHAISPNALSRYFTQGRGLTQRDILFLCKYFGIVIKVDVFLEKINPRTRKASLETLIKKWSEDSSQ